MKKLTHTDAKGKANMVDVTSKPDQIRQATAEGFIHLNLQALSLVRENNIMKGDVLTVAEIAGIQAGKKTSELIPLCHPLPLTKIAVETSVEETGIRVKAIARCTGKTGVEMEALTAVSVALLTIYDMCKAVDKQMVIDQIKLIEKSKI
ncbi:MAG TPA: cyclic pyranopterin monophosphate synthase MoaC [Bacteroidales bacterium]|nr:cyclic pyranopterin monophosphate synthase MoaC [Bacteroidales bacterium]